MLERAMPHVRSMQKRRLTKTTGMRAPPPDLNGTEPAMLYADTGIARVQCNQGRASCPDDSAFISVLFGKKSQASNILDVTAMLGKSVQECCECVFTVAKNYY
jgi:hypothetical protein